MSEFLAMMPAAEIVARFAINTGAVLIMLFGLYYRRYRDKELVTTAAMFNIFAFCVLTILSNVNFSVSAGFGLFAILALFSLRSEQISKIEITYFFGAISLAVICAVQGTTLPFVVFIATMILLGAYVFDHPLLLRSAAGVKITLDKIDAHSLSNPAMMRADLSSRLGVEVVSYNILALDYINDMARVDVFFRKPKLLARRIST
jgi:ABC-type antimicrobial peptide transport system permease subunit